MNERLENHTYCPNGDSESGGAPIFTISITLFQIGYFIYMYKWQYEKPVTSKIYWDMFNLKIFVTVESHVDTKNAIIGINSCVNFRKILSKTWI